MLIYECSRNGSVAAFVPAISRGRHFYLCPPPTMALSYEDFTIVNHRYRVAEQFPPIRYKSISATVNSPRKTSQFRLILWRDVVASRLSSLSPECTYASREDLNEDLRSDRSCL